ncbi:molecular chaperone [Taxawa tesnikishii (nom. ined.)]|nr:molecular chaperone [Dothideales sp. JES 119]
MRAVIRAPPQSRAFTCVFCQQPLQHRQPRLSSQTSPAPPSSRRFLSSTAQRSAVKESVAPRTHYDFFPQTLSEGPPPGGHFSVDLRALRREFLQLQAKAHPDLAPPDRKRQAEGLSARINEAYKTLQNPLLRAQYLLSLQGIDVAEDETLKVEDPELLMEVLETRETIEDAQSEEDLEPLKAMNEERVERSVKVLEDAFKNGDIQTAKEEAVRLRYWVNIRESIDAWEQGKPVVLAH